MSDFKIPVAATPPTQPATPPPRPTLAQACEMRNQALLAAIQYAPNGVMLRQDAFWDLVEMFECYISTGKRGDQS